MPLIQEDDYHCPFYLPNAHWQTIFPSVFRKIKGVRYVRERIDIFDGDFLDLDWSFVGEKPQNRGKLVILTHGLEGDSYRPYIKGMAKAFNEQGYDALAWNLRSCSGEMNRLPRFYHHGYIEDLEAVIEAVLQKYNYSQISLIGFSLGGNLTLKYLGLRQNVATEIKKAVVFSVPADLKGSAMELEKRSNWVYNWRFKQKLIKKVKRKISLMPDKINASHLQGIKTLADFTNTYATELHNFTHPDEYYLNGSSKLYVQDIKTKTLIINAQNDMMLTPTCSPAEIAKTHDHVYLQQPLQGGHCGFPTAKGLYWSEKRALEFILKP